MVTCGHADERRLGNVPIPIHIFPRLYIYNIKQYAVHRVVFCIVFHQKKESVTPTLSSFLICESTSHRGSLW